MEFYAVKILDIDKGKSDKICLSIELGKVVKF